MTAIPRSVHATMQDLPIPGTLPGNSLRQQQAAPDCSSLVCQSLGIGHSDHTYGIINTDSAMFVGVGVYECLAPCRCLAEESLKRRGPSLGQQLHQTTSDKGKFNQYRQQKSLICKKKKWLRPTFIFISPLSPLIITCTKAACLSEIYLCLTGAESGRALDLT